MATVYEAREAPPLERTVALKVLPPEFLHHESFRARFEHEAKLVAGLEHPGVVPIYASGIDEGLPWMSMRLMRDGSLAALLGRGLGIERTTRVLRGVAEALDYAHARGVLHRDIKPHNILLDATGRGCLSDFGLARLLERPEAWTATGTVAGTPHYMSPEQGLGKPIDRASDLYSLGVVAYEMLTGVTPFRGDSPVAIGKKHVDDALPVPARELVPGAVFGVLQKGLAKRSADRWPSAVAFVDALEKAGAVSPSTVHRRQTAAAVSLLVIAATAVAGLWVAVPRPAPRPASLLPSRTFATVWNRLPDTLNPEPLRPGFRSTAPGGWCRNTARGKYTASVTITPNPLSNRAGTTAKNSKGTETGAFTRDGRPDRADFDAGRRKCGPGRNPATGRRARTGRDHRAETDRAGQADLSTDRKGPADRGRRRPSGLCRPRRKVTSITVVEPAHALLNRAAVEAFSQFRYEPATRNGTPVPSRVRVTVSFALK